eukprot:163617_1
MGCCESTENSTGNAVANADKYQTNCTEHEKIIAQLQKENDTLKKQVADLLKQLDAADELKDKLMNNRFDDIEEDVDDEDVKAAQEMDIDPSNYDFWTQMDKKLEQGDIDYFRALLSSNKFDIKRDFHPNTRQSLLHLAAQNGRLEVVRMCINLGADISWPDAQGKEPWHCSEAGSYYHVSQLLMFAKLGGNLGAQIKDNINTIKDQNGVIDCILRTINELCGDKQRDILDCIENAMITILEQKVAFSDDLLMLAWQYSMQKYSEDTAEFDPLNCPLWKCIAHISAQITSKSNPRDWFWFKKYLVPSLIWYYNLQNDDPNDDPNEETKDADNIDEQMVFDADFDAEEYAIELERKEATEQYRKRNKTHYLFYELLKIVNKAAESQSNWLRQPMQDIADHNDEKWHYLSTYKYENKLYKPSMIRQDVIPNGVKSSYKHEELTKKTNASSHFNPHSYYDINEYLSKLVMAAHFNDERFQQSIMKVFDINKKSNLSNINKRIKYQRGPVKLLERCKAKAETDYRFEKWPTSAHILDINRCALVFEDIDSLVDGIQRIEQMIKDTQAGCIVDIVRTKNGFMEYTHDAPTYADIKLNVLIKGKYNSCIGEIQFLLAKMMQFKKRAHSLYGVTRKEEFVQNMAMTLPTMLDMDRTLFVSGNEGDVKALCNVMVTHNKQKEDLVMIDQASNESILHNICWLGHVKAFKFLYSILDKDLFLNRVLLPNRYNDNPIKGIIENTDYEMMALIFPESDANTADKKHEFAMELYDKIKSSKEEIWRIIQHACTVSFDMVQFVITQLNIDEQTLIECCVMKESDFSNYITNYEDGDGHEKYEGLTWLTSLMIGLDNTLGIEKVNALKYILSLVKKNGSVKMIDFLRCRGYTGENIVAACTVQGYYDSLKIILESECANDEERRELILAADGDNSCAISDAFDPVDDTHRFEMIQYLLRHFKEWDDEKKMELVSMSASGHNVWTRAVGTGQLEIVQYIDEFCPLFLEDKENVISRSEMLPSVLVCCCETGSAEVTEWLLFGLKDGKYGKDLIMEFDDDGMTPLTKALVGANVEVAELILSVFDDSDKQGKLDYIHHKDKYEFDTLGFAEEALMDYPEIWEDVEGWIKLHIEQLEI